LFSSRKKIVIIVPIAAALMPLDLVRKLHTYIHMYEGTDPTAFYSPLRQHVMSNVIKRL